MNVLRIKDWDRHFENNRTRGYKSLRWVPVPNKQDGDGYTELVEHPDGPAHYAAWVALVLVASKCVPRGTLLREANRPHDSGSLSRISRMPRSVFDGSIPRLLEIEWLEEVDVSEVRTTGAGQPAVRPTGAGEAQEDDASGLVTIRQTTARSRQSKYAERNGTEKNGTEKNFSVTGTGAGTRARAPSQQDWEFFQTIPELAEACQQTVEPQDPGHLVRSAFRVLKESHLSCARTLSGWHRRALGCHDPIVGGTRAHLLLTIAAGLHAASVRDEEIKKTRVAFFSNLIRRRMWQKVAYKLPKAVENLAKVEGEPAE